MSNEIRLKYYGPSTGNIVAFWYTRANQVYNTNTSAFEALTGANLSANIGHYGATAFAQVGSTPYYLGSVPSGIPLDTYTLDLWLTATGTPQASDLVQANDLGTFGIDWRGASLGEGCPIDLLIVDPLGASPLTFRQAAFQTWAVSAGQGTATRSGTALSVAYVRHDGSTLSFTTNDALSGGYATGRTRIDTSLP